MSLIGGMAVASLGGLAAAEAAQPATRPEAKPEPAPANDAEAVTAFFQWLGSTPLIRQLS